MILLRNTLALTTLLSLRAATGNDTFPPAPADLELKTYTALTHPIPLSVGEVSNKFHNIKIPSGPLAVYEFKADIVELDPETNEVIPVPLNEAYLHHHVVGSKHKAYKHLEHIHTPMKPGGMFKGVGFGAGSESRGTPQKFYYPFAFTTQPDEDEWIANVHVINTREMTTQQAHRCLECPCTSEDEHVDGTINGSKRKWDLCNEFLSQVLENDSCHLDTYKGGLRCCENGEFCLERSTLPETSPVSTFYLRYTLSYAELRPTNRPLGLAACCDVTGDLERHGNVEYDVPQCDDPVNNPEECVYELTTVQEWGAGSAVFGAGTEESVEGKSLDVVYIIGHLHRGGIEIELKDEVTGEVICVSKPSYGKDLDVVGEENDYLVSMSACTFNPPRRMKTDDLVRVTAKYDSKEAHTGVMSLFYIATAEPADEETVALPMDTVEEELDVQMLGASATVEEETAAPAATVEKEEGSSSFKMMFVSISFIAIAVGAVKKFGIGRKRQYTPIEAVNITV